MSVKKPFYPGSLFSFASLFSAGSFPACSEGMVRAKNIQLL